MTAEVWKGRDDLSLWKAELEKNPFRTDTDFQHTMAYYFGDAGLEKDIDTFGEKVFKELEPLVRENHLPENLPKIVHFDGVGMPTERIAHHPAYEKAGDIIYSSDMMKRLATPGRLLEALSFLFLSSQVGEAGHNCPAACSAGIIRVLQKTDTVADKESYLKKLTAPSYKENFTGAQFITEVQGGSDVGANETQAVRDSEGKWLINGEKWFCSNANADLILTTARFDPDIEGTKGLGLFLVPARLESGKHNQYTFRRLKDKMGTKTLATAEIEFQGAVAFPVGEPEEGFKLLMENVLHISRLFNAFCVLGMARRAYTIALSYARCRKAFGRPILDYPLVQQSLARIKVENQALTASAYRVGRLQDDLDFGRIREENKLLLRLLANINKTLTALWSVEHIHHSLDVLAGNGTIESFSSIPRLLSDALICENWEGTHNVLHMQILRDIHKFDIDALFLDHVKTLLNDDSLDPRIAGEVSFLEQNLEQLRSSNESLQTLQIKTIVYQMAIIYAALSLHKEAEHQQRWGSDSKKMCLELFLDLHFTKDEIQSREKHLISYKKILGSQGNKSSV